MGNPNKETELRSRLFAVPATIACVVLAMALATPASADAVAEDSTVETIEAAVPEVVARAEPVVETGDGLVAIVPEGTVSASPDASDGVAIDINEVEILVVLPSADHAEATDSEAEAFTYDNGDGSSSAVFANSDNSVTFVSVLESSDSPDRYTYEYQGVELRQSSDGGVTLWSEGVQVGYLLTPWAVDASGQDVPTHYEVEGGLLTQVVDHTSRTYEYPIVADPTQNLGGNSLYSNIKLDINPSTATTIVRVTPAPNINWVRMPRSTGLASYYALVPSAYEGQKYQDQLVCHWANAGYLKVPWNLDSWRPNVGYAATVLAACNP